MTVYQQADQRRVVLALSVDVMAACARPQPNPPVRDPVFEVPVCPPTPESPPTPLAAAAKQLIAKAVAGVFDRGEQDQMLKIEAKLPGFCGWYLAGGEVVAHMKPSYGVDSVLVRKTLYEEYAARPEEYVRRIMAPATHAKIKAGQFSLSELIAIENNVASPRVRIPGFTGSERR